MLSPSHQLVGLAAGLAAARVAHAGPLETAAVATAAWQGSLLPDADQLGARVHRRSRLERRSVVFALPGALLRVPLTVFGALATHRGLAHSLLAGAGLGALAWLALAPLDLRLASLVAAGLSLGYISHLAADGCTPGGVALWAPFAARRVRLLPALLRIPTGSLRELAVASFAGAATLALCVGSLG